jgi:hypothetical protein
MNLIKRVVQFKKAPATPKQKRLLRALRFAKKKMDGLTRQSANLYIKAYGEFKIAAARQRIKEGEV